MHRTQILLEEWQYQALKAQAEQEQRSISGLIRELLRTSLAPIPRARRRLDQIEGIGEDADASGKAHDDFLYGRNKNR